MTTSYTPLLGLALPVEGELDGAWGDVVNDSITSLVESSIAGFATASVTAGDWTLTTTGSGLANQARMAILIPTGTPGVTRNIIVPSYSKSYLVINQSNASVVVKGAATTGVTISAGNTNTVAWNGSDFVTIGLAVVNLTTNVTGTLPVGNGGTGAATLTGLVVGNGTSAMSTVSAPSGTVVGTSDTQTLTNKTLQRRVVTTATATSITINADTTDIALMANTQAAGTFTVNAPSGTPYEGQTLVFRMRSTNVQTFSWNAIFQGATSLSLPTSSSGSSKYDYFGFMYNSIAAKWQLVGLSLGY